MAAPRVLVTDAGRGSAIAVIRSLGRREMHVIAADSRALSPGFYSRYASARVRYPNPSSDPDGAVDEILKAARDHRVDLIVPVTDEVILPLSREHERFAGASVLALPDRKSLTAVHDKLKTIELARKLGVPTPKSAFAATLEEARTHAATMSRPLVLKPQASRIEANDKIGAFGVAYAHDDVQLERAMRRFEGRVGVVLQEYCRGEGYGVGILAHRGRPLAAFQHRRLREVPWTGGASSFRESVRLDPRLYDYSVRILGSLAWTGLAMVEFKAGSDEPKLMEINGRIWGSFSLAPKSGLDLPAMLADLYLSGPPPPDADRPATSYEVGIRSRDLRLELAWIASVLRRQTHDGVGTLPPRREALAALRRLASGDDGFDVLSREDPLPGLAEIAGLLGLLSRRVVRLGRTWRAGAG
jgi:predicted ATP-grasp superfamily ATP-dependent carboligase